MESCMRTLAAVAAVSLALGMTAARAASPGPVSGKDSRLMARGRYLVTRAAPCADCHSPRGRTGRPLAGHALQGAPIGFTPLHPVPGWKTFAPEIAGLPRGWTFAQTVHFLETGVTPDGGHAGPPMPAFRFDERDARAIATYLQSLPVAEKPPH